MNFKCYCHYRTIYLLVQNALLNNVENEYNNQGSTESEIQVYNEYLIKKIQCLIHYLLSAFYITYGNNEMSSGPQRSNKIAILCKKR